MRVVEGSERERVGNGEKVEMMREVVVGAVGEVVMVAVSGGVLE